MGRMIQKNEMELFVQNISIEQNILSTIIYHPEIFSEAIKEGLKASDFSYDFHQKIFNVMGELNKDSYIEEGLIITKLGKNFNESMMLQILTANPISNIKPYIKELISMSALAKLRVDTATLLALIDSGASLNDALSHAHKNNTIDMRESSLKIHRLSEIEGKDAEFICKSFLPFPKATVSMVAAGGGVGKTFLLIQTAMRIIDEENLKVFMWLTEDKVEISKKRAELIATKILEKDIQKYDNKLFISGSDSEVSHFLEESRDGLKVSSEFYRFQKMVDEFDVIIIDPLIAVFGGDENSNSHAKQFISLFTTWATNSEKTIIFIHHATKGTSTQRGASAFADAVRMIYQIEMIKQKEGQERILDDGMRNIIVAKDNYGSKNILGAAEVKRKIFPPQKPIPLVVIQQKVSMPEINWN